MSEEFIKLVGASRRDCTVAALVEMGLSKSMAHETALELADALDLVPASDVPTATTGSSTHYPILPTGRWGIRWRDLKLGRAATSVVIVTLALGLGRTDSALAASGSHEKKPVKQLIEEDVTARQLVVAGVIALLGLCFRLRQRGITLTEDQCLFVRVLQLRPMSTLQEVQVLLSSVGKDEASRRAPEVLRELKELLTRDHTVVSLITELEDGRLVLSTD